MRTLVLFTTLAMTATACDDASCLEDVCADHSETRALPGPCAVAANRSVKRCDITYDSENRPASAVCTVYVRYTVESRTDMSWTYDATTGELATYESKNHLQDGTVRWTWEPTRVRAEYLLPNAPPVLTHVYDRALFAFDPEPTPVHLIPIASLGLLSGYEGSMLENYTWTRAGNRLTRTDGEGTTTTYDLDERGRLISIDDGDYTYGYDGDRLVSHYAAGDLYTYTYDAGGNISEYEDTFGQKRIFGYDCW